MYYIKGVKLLNFIINLESIIYNLNIDLSDIENYLPGYKSTFDLVSYKRFISRLENSMEIGNILVRAEKKAFSNAIIEKSIINALKKIRLKNARIFITSIFAKESIEYFLELTKVRDFIEKTYDRSYGIEEYHKVKVIIEENKLTTEYIIYIGIDERVKKLGIFCLSPEEFFGDRIYEVEIY